MRLGVDPVRVAHAVTISGGTPGHRWLTVAVNGIPTGLKVVASTEEEAERQLGQVAAVFASHGNPAGRAVGDQARRLAGAQLVRVVGQQQQRQAAVPPLIVPGAAMRARTGAGAVIQTAHLGGRYWLADPPYGRSWTIRLSLRISWPYRRANAPGSSSSRRRNAVTSAYPGQAFSAGS